MVKSKFLPAALPSPALLQLLALATLLASGTRASPSVDVADRREAVGADPPPQDAAFTADQLAPLLVGILSWQVLVVTLEVNDFRARLATAYTGCVGPCAWEAPSADWHPRRHVAALVAIRYGLYDALVDWSLLYTLGYGLVAGLTYTDADPDAQLVFSGFALVCCAALLALSGLKLPHWLGLYRRSRLQLLADTSHLAPAAARECAAAGSTLAAFRYQVRVGVGQHFSQFACFALPFYVGLRAWAYLLSIAVGAAFGHFVLYVVFVCRHRFKNQRGIIAVCASVFVLIVSALVFTRGMCVVEKGWNRNVGNEDLFLTLSFFVWLALCLVGTFVRRYEQDGWAADTAPPERRSSLFEDSVVGGAPETGWDSAIGEEHVPDGGPEIAPSAPDAPLLDRRGGRATPTHPRRASYLKSYESAYFDRVSFRGERTELMDDGDGGAAARKLYATFTASERSTGDVTWQQRLWHFLPFRPAWHLFAMGARDAVGCCRTEAECEDRTSTCHRCFFALSACLKVGLNLLAIYVAVVACGATVQRKTTLAKLPVPEHTLYGSQMNEGPVCAFNEKCADIETFASREEADLADYTIAHCGPCGACSNWNDLALQSTDLATPARTCGQQHILGGIPDIQTCIVRDIGFTQECALHWAKNVVCSRKHCAFIFLQSLMTNQVGNFEVGPDTVTSATCSEASCEAGNPGNFVAEVGANRRRMNVESEIERPRNQQCAIVGIDENSRGYAMWEEFLTPLCEAGR